MKKVLLTVLAALAVVSTGCGSGNSAKPTKPAGPNIAKLVQAATAAQAKQKSVHMAVTTMVSTASQTTHADLDADFIMKPLQMRGTSQVTGQTQPKPVELYYDAKHSYLKVGDHWIDASKSMTAMASPAGFAGQLRGDQIKAIPQSALKQAKLKRTKTTDTVTMTFTGKRAKAIWTQGQRAQAGAGSDSQLKQTSIKKLHYQLVIDRTSQLPQQYQLRITVKRQGQTIDELITITYTKWGKVTITTPDLK